QASHFRHTDLWDYSVVENRRDVFVAFCREVEMFQIGPSLFEPFATDVLNAGVVSQSQTIEKNRPVAGSVCVFVTGAEDQQRKEYPFRNLYEIFGVFIQRLFDSASDAQIVIKRKPELAEQFHFAERAVESFLNFGKIDFVGILKHDAYLLVTHQSGMIQKVWPEGRGKTACQVIFRPRLRDWAL